MTDRKPIEKITYYLVMRYWTPAYPTINPTMRTLRIDLATGTECVLEHSWPFGNQPITRE